MKRTGDAIEPIWHLFGTCLAAILTSRQHLVPSKPLACNNFKSTSKHKKTRQIHKNDKWMFPCLVNMILQRIWWCRSWKAGNISCRLAREVSWQLKCLKQFNKMRIYAGKACDFHIHLNIFVSTYDTIEYICGSFLCPHTTSRTGWMGRALAAGPLSTPGLGC